MHNKSDQNLLEHLHQEELDYKIKLHEEIKQNFISQSGSLTKVARCIVGAILATIWVICYKESKICIPNGWLLASIISAFIYFFVELGHYYVDSFFYKRESDEIVKSDGNFDFDEKNKRILQHSNCSYKFLCAKAYISLILGFLFIIGICVL